MDRPTNEGQGGAGPVTGLMNRLLALDGVSFYALVLFAAQGVGLFRFFVVARQLGDEIQGEVVILGMVVSFFATVLVLNTAWQLVQSDNFNEPGFQSTLQGVALIRGVATGIIIAVAGYTLLGAMGIPELQRAEKTTCSNLPSRGSST